MFKVHMMRSYVNHRLSAAVNEVFELFERTIAEYEQQLSRSKEENDRKQKLLDAVMNPEVPLPRPVSSDVQQVVVREEEVLLEQQERISSLSQEEPPEPAHIKVEQDDPWSSQEREQLQRPQEADISVFPSYYPVMRDGNDGERPQSSQFCQTQNEPSRYTEHFKTEVTEEDCRGSEADFNPDRYLQPITPDETSNLSISDADDSFDWEEGDETQQQQQEHKGVNTEEKPFKCINCDKCYQTRRSLKIHMQRHSVEKPFSCSVCQKSFLWKAEMEMHMRVHTGEKPFCCSFCGKRFAVQGNLRQHLTVHTGEKPFGCNVCDRKFSKLVYVKNHKCKALINK
ncbi:zinc finger protein 184-like [Cheilinus undulatus]|uniref:zinc finger protein 184-like n=1 Tax=Cheilinus undulatus TaxID=241271 RepID=UPI001BD41C1E|nr:zinc finger protein 184-like [Cheilinus undulatus]